MSDNSDAKIFTELNDQLDALEPVLNKMEAALTNDERRTFSGVMRKLLLAALAGEGIPEDKQEELRLKADPLFEKMQKALTEEENAQFEGLMGAFVKAAKRRSDRTQAIIERSDAAAEKAREAIERANEVLGRSGPSLNS